MHADRTNRVVLSLLALLLIGIGLDAGAASLLNWLDGRQCTEMNLAGGV